MDEYYAKQLDDEELAAAGIGWRSRTGKGVAAGFRTLALTMFVVVLVIANIASFAAAVGMVLKFFEADFMAPWTWGTLILMFIAPLVVTLIFAMVKDS